MRTRLKLPPFRQLARLDAAADTQANIGRLFRPPSHLNPFPTIATPWERVNSAGLDPALVAENIASLSVYDIEPGIGVGVTYRDGRRLLVHPETEEELRPSTSRRFPDRVGQAWMDSPLHRAHVVSPQLQFMGCSVRLNRDYAGLGNLLCGQVFFTPN